MPNAAIVPSSQYFVPSGNAFSQIPTRTSTTPADATSQPAVRFTVASLWKLPIPAELPKECGRCLGLRRVRRGRLRERARDREGLRLRLRALLALRSGRLGRRRLLLEEDLVLGLA